MGLSCLRLTSCRAPIRRCRTSINCFLLFCGKWSECLVNSKSLFDSWINRWWLCLLLRLSHEVFTQAATAPMMMSKGLPGSYGLPLGWSGRSLPTLLYGSVRINFIFSSIRVTKRVDHLPCNLCCSWVGRWSPIV